jgi:hypothetical protein
MDESEDQEFYGQARLVTHIDDAAIGASEWIGLREH